MRSSTIHRAQKMPVLPTPSLLKERIEGTSNISKTFTVTSARLSVGCREEAGGRGRYPGGKGHGGRRWTSLYLPLPWRLYLPLRMRAYSGCVGLSLIVPMFKL